MWKYHCVSSRVNSKGSNEAIVTDQENAKHQINARKCYNQQVETIACFFSVIIKRKI